MEPASSETDPPHQPWLRALLIAVLALATWFAFSPALHGGWVWDDTLDLVDNRLLRDADGLWKIWFQPTAGLYDYYPLKFTVQWVQWHLWQNDTFGYHVTNVVLHFAGALLFWRVLRRLGVRHGWIGAVLFAVHPLTVESVAWVTELKNTLSLPLLLLAVDRWLAFDEHGRGRDYAAALALFLASLLSKTSGVMLPATLLLHAWWRRGRINARDAARTAPFFAVALALGLVTVWFQQRVALGEAAANFNPVGGPLARMLCAGSSALFYLGKAFAPLDLNPIYPQWSLAEPEWWVWLAWPIFAAAFFAAWWLRARGGRHAMLGLGWFLLIAAPVLGFVTISSQRFSWVLDHLAYTPLLGVLGVVAAAVSAGIARLPAGFGRLVVLCTAILSGVLAGVSRAHSEIFQNEETLWTAAVERNPNSWFAHFTLGNALRTRGLEAEAILHYEHALVLRPNFAEAHYNLGNALAAVGRREEALAAYLRATELQPTLALAHSNRAVLLAQLGRDEEAIEACEAALKIRPEFYDAQLNAGLLLLRANRPDEALPHLAVAVRMAPHAEAAQFNYANALVALARPAEAIAHYEAALKRAPDNAQILARLARALATVGRTNEAHARYERARALDTTLPPPDF